MESEITEFQDLPDFTGLHDFTIFLVYVVAFLFLLLVWEAVRDSKDAK